MIIAIIVGLVLLFIAYKVFNNIESDEPIEFDKSKQTKSVKDSADGFHIPNIMTPDLSYLELDKLHGQRIPYDVSDAGLDKDARFDSLNVPKPEISHFMNPNFINVHYDDSYKTGTPLSLREILLLVWFGKSKNGRKVDKEIPAYFKFNYGVNGHLVKQKLIKGGLLLEKDNRFVLSSSGQFLVNTYADLWDIHSANYNLDQVFPRWHNGDFVKYVNKAYDAQRKTYLLSRIKLYNYCAKHPEIFSGKTHHPRELKYIKQIIKDNVVKSDYTDSSHDISRA